MKSENQLVSAGTVAFAFGALAFLPSLMGRELLILSWLGGMAQPVGLSAMVVGGVLFGLGKLQTFRDAPPAGFPSDPAPLDPATPIVQPNVLANQAPVSKPLDRE
ncbi:MAG TPA: hypothetical protein VFY18_05905 [Candidatus Limnocylindrales bacterium]|nr:hypothetical protein [Candidatus Limnocylindrales bacterium]